MTTLTPTPEQSAIIDFAQSSTANLIVEARAGAAKTTTLLMIASAITQPILFLAFNKKIADEATERLPAHATARTINGLGHRAWGQQLNKRLFLNKKKNFDLIRFHIADSFSADERQLLDENFSDLIRTVSFAKQCGYVPDAVAEQRRTARPLCTDDEFFDERCEYILEPEERRLVRLVMRDSIDQALAGKIDFDDQIYMPTIFPCSFERFPVVMIDEAQDLSLINHAMLRKIAKRSRLIAVGDPCQAIYGFRGAHQNSMDLLAEQFSMHRMYLTTSFRCPIAVTSLAQQRAPDMTYPEWAQAGSVIHLTQWTPSDIRDTSTIICRNNAPLFRIALALIRAGRSPDLQGRDILRNIYNKMKKLGPAAIRRAQLHTEIDQWYERELRRQRDAGLSADMRDAMRLFADEGETLAEALASIEALAMRDGRIKLTTAHKAKGLEWSDVFILDQHLCNWERGQDNNIWYVAVTRSQLDLTFITTDGLVMAKPDT